MKIEIWSDVACPFCYIGKRQLEMALEQLGDKVNIEIEWKSYQLNPELQAKPNQNINEYLAEHKGWTIDHARSMNQHVIAMAAEVGLTYNMDDVKVANTANAHRLIQLAKSKGLADAMEEKLFSAYFTEGKNIGDRDTLVSIALETGIDGIETMNVLNGDSFAQELELDAYEAAQIGVRGVPFFVFDRKYAISGAQPLEVFINTLNQVKSEAEIGA